MVVDGEARRRIDNLRFLLMLTMAAVGGLIVMMGVLFAVVVS